LFSRFPLRPLLRGILLVLLLLLLTAFTILFSDPPPGGEEGDGEPTPTPLLSPRQLKPVIPDNPTMADKGSIVWWGICMACHGDKGQGLTDEWRQTAFGEDMNCWQSKCHGYNHPPEGFLLPRLVPPAFGPGTLKRFVTAEDLHQYIKTSMPWWKPGSLSEDQAWEVTAFILREQGALPQGVEFYPKDASTTPVHLPVRSITNERTGQWTLIVTLSLAALVIIVGNALKGFVKRAKNGAMVSAAQANIEAQPKGKARPNFYYHLHPPTIPLPQARWRYTLGAGGLAVFLSLVLGITGILELFFYIPTPEQAGPSIQVITFEVPFGLLVRGIHFWAAQALVVVAMIHLLRVIFTGAYVLPRRFNFLIGLAMLVLILLLDFTGYVLRWDEGIRWALTVGTSLLKTTPWIGNTLYGFVVGGDQPGLATLTRFYAWHIFGLTLAVVGLIAWHIFRVRRDGGIAAPPPEDRLDGRRITRFELVRREALAALIATLALILVSMLLPTPLAQPIQTGVAPLLADVRAPWFFLWIQQLLRYGNAFWLGVALPLGVLFLLAALPYLFPHIPDERKGSWFPRTGRAAQIIAVAIVLGWLALTILELLQ
jgi:quinol-cytochrome oxidoreductase complex cytochrome b subunit